MEGKKIALELNLVADGREFLNFWGPMHGNDVTCQVKDGKLMLQDYDAKKGEFTEEELTIFEFLALVKKSARKV